MTVRRLIEILKGVDPERRVVLSIDPEGNGFAPLKDWSEEAYRNGETGLEELTPSDKKKGYSEDDVLFGGRKCVVLWTGDL